jgi:hypothetical protein
VSAGWGSLLTRACSGITTLRPDMPSLSMAGSGYLCAATVGMNIFQHSSRGAGRILRRNGSSLTCTFNLLGRTNSCPPPPFIKAQRTEPPMIARLAALVKRISELHAAGLKACHCIEEFHHRRIRPLDHQKRRAYECPWMVNLSHEPTEGKLPIWSLEY